MTIISADQCVLAVSSAYKEDEYFLGRFLIVVLLWGNSI